MQKVVRVALLALGGLSLLAGLDAALLLLGLPAPVSTPRLPQVHGPVLVLGFVGSLIALERSVALRRPWGHAAPALLGAGALLVLGPWPPALGRTVTVAGTAALLAVYAGLWRRQGSAALEIQVLGAVLAVGAAVTGLGAPVPAVLPWFVGFLVLTIAGERVELSRLTLGARAEQQAVLLAWAVAAGVTASTVLPGPGHVVLGAALAALVLWLGVHDVARRTVRSTGLPRFVAWCLLSGYAWLAVAAVTWVLRGAVTSGPAYDAVVHAVFLGFTLSMIMAHAPVILPAVLRTPLPYHPVLAAPVVLLHGSLLLRVLGGDVHGSAVALQVGGALNITAVLLFVALAAGSALRARRTARPGGTGRPAATAPVLAGAAR